MTQPWASWYPWKRTEEPMKIYVSMDVQTGGGRVEVEEATLLKRCHHESEHVCFDFQLNGGGGITLHLEEKDVAELKLLLEKSLPKKKTVWR